MEKTLFKQNMFILLFGIIACLILLEIGLRLGEAIFLSAQNQSKLKSLKNKSNYRILCLGESTTALGGEYSYPRQLEKVLNQKNMGVQFSVINKGVPATNTSAILNNLKNNLDTYKPDMVVVMMGVNDSNDKIAYANVTNDRSHYFFRSLKLFKFINLLNLRLKNKLLELGCLQRYPKKKANPESRVDYINQGLKYKSIGNYILAKEMFDRSIKLNLNVLSGYFHLGCVYKDEGLYTEAEKAFKRMVELDPENVDGYIQLGYVYYEQNKCIEAENMFLKAIKLSPFDPNIYVGIAFCYKKLKDYTASKKMFKKAIELDSNKVDYYIWLGSMLGDQGEMEEMEELFKEAIKAQPQNANGYIELGNYYYSQARYVKAEKMYEQAVKLSPDDVRALAGLSTVYREFNKEGLANKYLRKSELIRAGCFDVVTRCNYNTLKEIVLNTGIKLMCVQYPMLKVEVLKKMLGYPHQVIFVDNEYIFKEAVKKLGYGYYFIDNFGGEFGHCSPEDNRLLADNIAEITIREFHKIGN